MLPQNWKFSPSAAASVQSRMSAWPSRNLRFTSSREMVRHVPSVDMTSPPRPEKHMIFRSEPGPIWPRRKFRRIGWLLGLSRRLVRRRKSRPRSTGSSDAPRHWCLCPGAAPLVPERRFHQPLQHSVAGRCCCIFALALAPSPPIERGKRRVLLAALPDPLADRAPVLFPPGLLVVRAPEAGVAPAPLSRGL